MVKCFSIRRTIMRLIFIVIIIAFVSTENVSAEDIMSKLPENLPVLHEMSVNENDSLFFNLPLIPVDNEFVSDCLNPNINQLNYDITRQVGTYILEYFLLGKLQIKSNDYLLYSRGGNMTYEIFIADLSTANPYPKTLQIYSGPGGDEPALTFYSYEPKTNIISVFSERFDKDDYCIRENRYLLEHGFPEINEQNDLNDEFINLAESLNTISCGQLSGKTIQSHFPGQPIEPRLINRYLNPYVNVGNHAWSRSRGEKSYENDRYYLISKTVIQNNDYLIYARCTENSTSIYLAQFNRDGSMPKSLLIYGELENYLSADFQMDCSAGIITISNVYCAPDRSLRKKVQTFKLNSEMENTSTQYYCSDDQPDEFRIVNLRKGYKWEKWN